MATDIRYLLEHYQQLFASTDRGFGIAQLLPATATTAPDLRWLQANEAFAHLVQIPLAELTSGRTIRQLESNIEADWFAHYEQVVRTQQPKQFDIRVGRLATWFDVYAFPLGEAADRYLGILFYDIATRQRLTQQQQLIAVLEGQEEERRRIAESLHNGLGQLLYATKLCLEQALLQGPQPLLQQVNNLLREAIEQTRAISHELTPALLLEFGLAEAVHTVCRDLTSQHLRWHCHVDLADACAVPLAVQQAVYRLVQGLAHNVAKHAHARKANVALEALPSGLLLCVEDDGQGFDRSTVQEGLGLQTLRNRVALLNGILHLDSAPGQGTRITVRLPLLPSAAT